MNSGRVKANPIITHQYPISDAVEAFRVAEDKEKHGAVKVVITL
jgi:threonine dehydrogenase-like Zn-dependent dehydrogenase